ncbi:MAG: ABC transporter permease [Gemmatimonadales bacterium]
MPNLKLAIRTLARTPLVTGVAIASLALGIGANTAIFSLVRRVLLQPLPVPHPEQLVSVLAAGPNPGSQSCGNAGTCSSVFSYPMFRDLERAQSALTGLAGFRALSADLSFRGKSLSGDGLVVSGSYFQTLGLRPALGRLFGPGDDEHVGGHPVVVLTHRYWVNELGADPSVLDQTIQVNGHPMTIVGVAPPEFEGTTVGFRPRVFLPLSMRETLEPWSTGISESRRGYWIYAFGRLESGVTMAQAADHLNGIYTPIVQDVEVPLQLGMSEQLLTRFKEKKIRLESGSRGQSLLMGQTRTPLTLLFSVTGVVLLVACTNVANLLLARAAGRASEMAVRSSLGAGRRHLIGQLFAEAAVLSLLAGVLSIAVSRATLGLLVSFLPEGLAQAIDFQLDLPVLAFAAVVSLGTSLAFGLLPAIHSTRPDLIAITKSSGRGSGGRGAVRFRNGLVTAQIALSMALLSAAGLFIRSLVNVSRVELGLETEGVVSFQVAPGQIGYDSTRAQLLFERLGMELASLPGATGVTRSLVPIVRGSNNGNDVDVEGFPSDQDTDVNVRSNHIGSDYFATLGVPVLAGREFDQRDGPGSPGVAIVNQAFARKFDLGSSPIGRRLRLGNRFVRADDTPLDYDLEIVGLVKDVAYSSVKDEVPPVIYLAIRQTPAITSSTFYLRVTGDPDASLGAIEPLVARLEPGLPVADLMTLPDQVKENVFLDRMITTFSAGFALLATLLAAVGLYGVLAYTVLQRTREIGLRMALGADGGRVLGMVLKQVGWMTGIGVALGLAAALAIGRSAESLLYELAGTDLAAFLGAGLILAAVALGAGLVPALRASKVHPMEALRYD